jgi:hypothetical protein
MLEKTNKQTQETRNKNKNKTNESKTKITSKAEFTLVHSFRPWLACSVAVSLTQG